RVRRTLSEKRVGHTGTLDPFATGVMVILVGRATRLAQFLNGAVKEYEAVVRFGYATDTGDLTGARLERAEAQNAEGGSVHVWSEREIKAALAPFRGEIEQVPPMYSAKKIQGRKLYELARRGIEVERAAVPVTIYELEALRGNDAPLLRHNEDGTADLSIRVRCSAGTYIRTLAESIGEQLKTRAHLSSLRRTRAGDFQIETAVSLDELKAKLDKGAVATDFLLPMDAALSGLPFVHLTAIEARRALHGIALPVRDAAAEVQWQAGEPVRMRDLHGQLIAIGFYDEASGSLRPRVVFSPEK
ncbi:MAG TPA: tRNA pseudouridine(55) synthase TruB, partial [Pyrinomonadaceae bacterium]|nr:tRNA pseudouridine(55) synthase TruB [Pyrinomonadaceae bacterium]